MRFVHARVAPWQHRAVYQWSVTQNIVVTGVLATVIYSESRIIRVWLDVEAASDSDETMGIHPKFLASSEHAALMSCVRSHREHEVM